MTEAEQHAEAGRLLYERADLKRQLGCIESKLDRARLAFEAAVKVLESDDDWHPVERDDEGIQVPASVFSQIIGQHYLPSLDDFQRYLEEKHAVQARLAEINERLPD